jgi:hypothetical protein
MPPAHNSAEWKGSVILERKGTGEGLFEAKSLLDPIGLREREARGSRLPARAPEFLVSRQFFRTSWWARLGAIFSRYPAHLKLISNKLFCDVPVCPRRFAGKQMAASIVFHACAFLLLPYLLRYLPTPVAQASTSVAYEHQVIYYHLTDPVRRMKTPTIQPSGPGSTPGSGTLPEPPVRGASASQAAFFAVSRPRTPDNNHQTILQPLTQPDLKMNVDLKLPNLLLPKPQAPKAPLQFNPKSVKPLQHATREVVTVAPTLAAANIQQPLTDALLATNDRPKLAVPLGAPPAPNMPSRENGGSANVAAPEFEASGSPGQGLLILGTNPGTSADMVALPPGNRYGEFSIAPGGSGTGAPGGQPGGSPNGGTGGGVGGGNESTGVGTGKSGGGGGNSGVPGIVSIRGTDGAGENLGSAEPEHLASMVFALPKISGPRHNALLVAAGPMGGGGLDVYGALRCGKIFTVFLPAAGKGWTLQFCQTPEPAAAAAPAPKVYANAVRMEAALVPPEAETRFEFKRTPLPFEKLHKYVILKGRIDEDGKVMDLKVFQGLSAEMDAAAKLAFSQWTFKPAMKADKAVSVDILVGIPSDPPSGGTRNQF